MEHYPPLYERGNFWICKAKHGFEVYENGATHSKRRAIIGYEGNEGLKMAIDKADYYSKLQEQPS